MDLALDYAAGRGKLSSEFGWRYRPSAVTREERKCSTRDPFPSAATTTADGKSLTAALQKNSVVQGKAGRLHRWAKMRRANNRNQMNNEGAGQQLSLAFGSYRVLPRYNYE